MILKKCFIFMGILWIAALSGCAAQQTAKESDKESPTAVMTVDGDLFHLGDTQESVEKILGTENIETEDEGDKRRCTYPNGIRLTYDKSDKMKSNFMEITGEQYITYQEIKIGDSWKDVEDKLHVIKYYADTPTHTEQYTIGFKDGVALEEPEARDRLGEKSDYLLMRYYVNLDGNIENIFIFSYFTADLDNMP